MTSQCPSNSMEHSLRFLHLVKKFPAFYVASGFITMFTRATTYCSPELDEFSPCSPTLFHHDQFNMILLPMPRSSKWSLSCRLQCLSLSLSPILDFDKVQYGNRMIIELLSAFNFASEISTDYLKKAVIQTCLDKFSQKKKSFIHSLYFPYIHI